MDGDSGKRENPVEPLREQTDAGGGEQADYRAASESMPDYSQFTPQLRPKKKWPRVAGWILLALVVLGGLGAGGWWLAHHKAAPKPTQQQAKNSSQTSSQMSTSTKPYTSNDLGLNFNYPENWTVVDNGDGKLTATSPPMQLTDADGQTQTGQVVMTIQNEDAADFSMFKQGSAVAVLASQKIAYANPTSTQRADTYVSFLQYAATSTHSALDGVFITGNSGYQKDQAIPETDITKVDPDIRVTFTKCANSACTGTPTPLSISSEMWAGTGFSAPILHMLESLQIQ